MNIECRQLSAKCAWVTSLSVKCKMYKARDARPSIKPGHAPRARVSLAPGPGLEGGRWSLRHLLISDREDGSAAFKRTSSDRNMRLCISMVRLAEY